MAHRYWFTCTSRYHNFLWLLVIYLGCQNFYLSVNVCLSFLSWCGYAFRYHLLVNAWLIWSLTLSHASLITQFIISPGCCFVLVHSFSSSLSHADLNLFLLFTVALFHCVVMAFYLTLLLPVTITCFNLFIVVIIMMILIEYKDFINIFIFITS